LAYQLKSDEDVLGRIWALNQLQKRSASSSTDQSRITTELANALARDKFWAVRVEAATALAGINADAAREALVAATRDADARVRARAVTSLASFKHASLPALYVSLLDDSSYAVIKAAAVALGSANAPDSYESLVKLLNRTSWRDNIRASALSGLSELKDKRSLAVGLKYAERGNNAQVRAAALRVLGRVGGDSPEAFSLVATTASSAFAEGNADEVEGKDCWPA